MGREPHKVPSKWLGRGSEGVLVPSGPETFLGDQDRLGEKEGTPRCQRLRLGAGRSSGHPAASRSGSWTLRRRSSRTASCREIRDAKRDARWRFVVFSATDRSNGDSGGTRNVVFIIVVLCCTSTLQPHLNTLSAWFRVKSLGLLVILPMYCMHLPTCPSNVRHR